MKKTFTMAIILSAFLLIASIAQAADQTVSLATTMDPTGFISEDQLTAAFARINLGDGTLGTVGTDYGDQDGVYNILQGATHPNPTPLGTPIDIFPREANFLVGSLVYDDTAITGTGVETVAIKSIDLAEFWTSDPNRVGTPPGSGGPMTVISDISDQGMGLWWFNTAGGITFGGLDAADTVTFTDGVLTSINLEITTTFWGLDFGGGPHEWSGTFSIVGDQLSYQINDTIATSHSGTGFSTFVADLTGTVAAVQVNTAQVPAVAWPVGLFVSGLLGCWGSSVFAIGADPTVA
jgi:hypothetical protein